MTRFRGYKTYVVMGLLSLVSLLDLLNALDLVSIVGAIGVPEQKASMAVLLVANLAIVLRFMTAAHSFRDRDCR